MTRITFVILKSKLNHLRGKKKKKEKRPLVCSKKSNNSSTLLKWGNVSKCRGFQFRNHKHTVYSKRVKSEHGKRFVACSIFNSFSELHKDKCQTKERLRGVRGGDTQLRGTLLKQCWGMIIYSGHANLALFNSSNDKRVWIYLKQRAWAWLCVCVCVCETLCLFKIELLWLLRPLKGKLRPLLQAVFIYSV